MAFCRCRSQSSLFGMCIYYLMCTYIYIYILHVWYIYRIHVIYMLYYLHIKIIRIGHNVYIYIHTCICIIVYNVCMRTNLLYICICHSDLCTFDVGYQCECYYIVDVGLDACFTFWRVRVPPNRINHEMVHRLLESHHLNRYTAIIATVLKFPWWMMRTC